MTDDIELPKPDGVTLRLTDGTDRVMWRGTAPPGLSPVYTDATVRRLLAAAVAAERERLRAVAGDIAEAQRLADALGVIRGWVEWEQYQRDCSDAAALLREQAAELERLRAQHDECPLWPAEDER